MAETPVSVLGTGAIGSAVARALLRSGHEVHVWNRSPERASALVQEGARLADSASAAVSTTSLSLLCLTDHGAVQAVLSALPDQPSDRTVALLATGTPEEVQVSAAAAASRGLAVLAAGVQASPADVGTSAALFLCAGEAVTFAQHRTVLERLGRATWVGPSPDAAAVLDLALFGLWYDAQVGLLRALELTGRAGVPPSELAALAAPHLQHVLDGVAATVREVEARDYPVGPASLAEHASVLARICEARAASRLGVGGLDVVGTLVAGLAAGPDPARGLTAVLDVRA